MRKRRWQPSGAIVAADYYGKPLHDGNFKDRSPIESTSLSVSRIAHLKHRMARESQRARLFDGRPSPSSHFRYKRGIFASALERLGRTGMPSTPGRGVVQLFALPHGAGFAPCQLGRH